MDIDDDFGGFGGGADVPGFSGGGQSSVAVPKVKRQASARTNMYAKSPQQRRQEEAAAMEYQAALDAEQAKQNGGGGGNGGFGGFDDDFGGAPAAEAQRPNVWGQTPNAMGIVIPPFVPRDQRNAKVWDAGKCKKSVSDKAVMGADHGSFLIRETAKGDRHVVSVNDRGGLFEMYIRHLPEGRFLFMSREFDKLEDIVKHLQRNALYNKQGMPLYIDKPVKIEN